MRRAVLAFLLVILSIPPATAAETKAKTEPSVDRNIVFGMYSGLALLMDVYHPPKPNGFGIIFIPGSGWNTCLNYGARQLKDESYHLKAFVEPLNQAGYTVFVINHRATPRFAYPAPVEDAQRAVRYIRHEAQKFGINPEHLGAVGASSGAHLVDMLGVLDGNGNRENIDEINRLSAKVQCVVLFSPPADFTSFQPGIASAHIALLTGFLPDRGARKGTEEHMMLRKASPIYHVSADDAPTLLVHGDQDAIIPFQQVQAMEAALRTAGVPVKLLRIPAGKHDFFFSPPADRKDLPDYVGEMIRWLDRYLRNR